MNIQSKTIASAINRDKLYDAILDLAYETKDQAKRNKLIFIARKIRYNWS
jgi:hypothetical protein